MRNSGVRGLLPPDAPDWSAASRAEGSVTTTWVGVWLAILGGIGLTMLMTAALRFNRPSLVERVAPQMRSHTITERTQQPALTSFGTLSRITAPVIQAGVEQLNKLNLGNTQLSARLAQAGSRLTVADYRAQQLIMAVVAAALDRKSVVKGRGGGDREVSNVT